MTNTQRMSAERVYIAARFSRRHEANFLAHELQKPGHIITSRWCRPESDHIKPVGLSKQAADSERRRFAMEDLQDLDDCDLCISLMEASRNNSRGGRHVEFGYAIAAGKILTIIGPRETVFHHLPEVTHFDTVVDFIRDQKEGAA